VLLSGCEKKWHALHRLKTRGFQAPAWEVLVDCSQQSVLTLADESLVIKVSARPSTGTLSDI